MYLNSNWLGPSEYEDILQCNNNPRGSSGTPRGHQFPAAFMMATAGLDKHGVDSTTPLPYCHLDIAGSSGPFPGIPTGAPIPTMTKYFMGLWFSPRGCSSLWYMLRFHCNLFYKQGIKKINWMYRMLRMIVFKFRFVMRDLFHFKWVTSCSNFAMMYNYIRTSANNSIHYYGIASV